MKKTNKFKALVSFVLVIAMLCTVSVPFVSADVISSDTSQAQEMYTFMKAVGVFAEDEDDFNAETEISRAHFIKLAMHISNDAPEVLLTEENVFSDVTSKTAYGDYIVTAYRIGYISGNPGGLFRPDDTITLSEALKILCGILGYDKLAEELGGYPGGYIAAANRAKLLTGISIGDNTPLNMENAVLLLRNALDVELMQYHSFGETVEMRATEDETLLSIRHNIEYVEGIISATEYTDLYVTESELGINQILLGDVIFNDPDGVADEFIGCDVKLWYRKTDNIAIPEIVYVALTDNNKILTIDAEDIDFNGSNLVYYEEDGSIKNIRLNSKATYIQNKKMTAMTASDLVGISKGKISFISNDGNADADVIKVTKYESHIAAGVNKTDYLIMTKDGSLFEADETSREYSVYIEKDGKKAVFADLSVDDSLLISKSEGEGYGDITILASSKSVTGELTRLGEDYAVINSEEYKLGTAIHSSIKVGKTYKAIIDAFGEICYIEINDDVVYGYLYAITEPHIFLNPMCKIFTENNRWVELYLADKISFNGTPLLANDMYQKLLNMQDGYMQMIRYRVNDEAEIVRIDTAQEISSGSKEEDEAIKNDVFRISLTGSELYRDTEYSFNGKFFVDTNAKVFIIPTDKDEKKFKVSSPRGFIPDAKYSYTVYDMDETLTSRVITVPSIENSTIRATDSFMVAESIGETMTKDGEVVPALFGYRKDNYIGFPIELGDDGVAKETIDNIKKGDLVHIRFNDDSLINFMQVYSIDKEYYVSGTSLWNQALIMIGKVKKFDSVASKIRIKYAEGSEAAFLCTASLPIYVWDKSRETVYAGTAADIQFGDKIYAEIKDLQVSEIIIVRE